MTIDIYTVLALWWLSVFGSPGGGVTPIRPAP